MTDQMFKALRVSEISEHKFESNIINRSISELPDNEVLIEVLYSSVNYKDALSASGNKGVTRNYPHTPGIDAAGIVVSSRNDKFHPGDQVIVTGFDLGMNTDGGFAQFIYVPSSWVIDRPENLSFKHSMILGTAGLTAALCVEKLIKAGVTPDCGEILVTGATGGVGVIAISLLRKLGYDVIASTGKPSEAGFLESLGASVIDRAESVSYTHLTLPTNREV